MSELKVSICSLTDIANLHDFKLNDYEAVTLSTTNNFSGGFQTPDLAKCYVSAKKDIVVKAENANCAYVGCFHITFLEPSHEYMAEAIGLKPKKK
ncbi:MAG: hypothetical protein WC755_05180 [Candidatus Woesearchaeota archaeon]|jgi:hypothetical protein